MLTEQNQRKKEAILKKIEKLIVGFTNLNTFQQMVIMRESDTYFVIQYSIFSKTQLTFEYESSFNNDGNGFTIWMNHSRAAKRGALFAKNLVDSRPKTAIACPSADLIQPYIGYYLLPKQLYQRFANEAIIQRLSKIENSLTLLEEEISLRPNCRECGFDGGIQFKRAQKSFERKQAKRIRRNSQ